MSDRRPAGAAWDYRARVATRTVFATVNRLRKKVEFHPNEPAHILTEYGGGYRFVGRLADGMDGLPKDPTVVDALGSLDMFCAPFPVAEARHVLDAP